MSEALNHSSRRILPLSRFCLFFQMPPNVVVEYGRF
jgi:hypothetical protein